MNFKQEGWCLYCTKYGLYVKMDEKRPVLIGTPHVLDAQLWKTKEKADVMRLKLREKCYDPHDDKETNDVRLGMTDPANWRAFKTTITVEHEQ